MSIVTLPRQAESARCAPPCRVTFMSYSDAVEGEHVELTREGCAAAASAAAATIASRVAAIVERSRLGRGQQPAQEEARRRCLSSGANEGAKDTAEDTAEDGERRG